MKEISTSKWLILYLATGFVDVAQILIDLTGVGIAVSTAAEPFIGAAVVIVCQLMGIRMIDKPKRLASLLGVTVAGALTGGIAPFWILDIWYIHWDVRREEKARKEAEIQETLRNFVPPVYDEDGVRRPEVDVQADSVSNTPSANIRTSPPLYSEGIRPPQNARKGRA